VLSLVVGQIPAGKRGNRLEQGILMLSDLGTWARSWEHSARQVPLSECTGSLALALEGRMQVG
jgi:hypothetical protein